MTKGKDDLGDFEERTAKKGDASDQFVDPFKRKGAKAPKDVDGEVDEEQRAKEAKYRVKVDESGEPVDKESVPPL